MRYLSHQQGFATLVFAIFFVGISTAVTFAFVTPATRQLQSVRVHNESKQSYVFAESGVEDILYRINNSMDISPSEDLSLGNLSTTTTYTNTGVSDRRIVSTGGLGNYARAIQVDVFAGDGVSFNYGVQVGTGGFVLGGNAGVIGNVYANGPIVGSNGAYITGTAVSATDGGTTGLINNVDIGDPITGLGDAWAYEVSGSTIVGALYCQTGSGNDQLCDTSLPDPEPQDYPIAEEQILDWKAEAEAGGVISGDYATSGSTSTLGPVKIEGDLDITNGHVLVLEGAVWVTGNITLENNAEVELDSGYGESSEVVIADGYIDMSNNADFRGSGSSDSYIVILSTSDCPDSPSCGGNYAISIENNAGAVVAYAQEGTILFSNNAGAASATADTIELANNAEIIYEQGLASTSFTSGPSGSWNIVSWEEVE